MFFSFTNDHRATDGIRDFFTPKKQTKMPDDKYEKAKLYLEQRWQETKEQQRQIASERLEEEAKPGIGEKISEKVLGGKLEEIKEYKDSVSEEDTQKNTLEVYVAPGYLGFDANSASFYRKMRSNSASLHLGARIWFSPFAGIEADYKTSLGASVLDDIATESTSLISHEWFHFGLVKRIILDESSDYMKLSLNYKTYNFKVPADSPYRGNIDTTMYGFGLSYHRQKSFSYERELGIRLYLAGNENEKGATVDFSSGTHETSYGLHIWHNWKYRLNRKNAVFFNIQYQLEKHNYSGTSYPADPKTSSTLNGVDIESNFYFLELGYEWGS